MIYSLEESWFRKVVNLYFCTPISTNNGKCDKNMSLRLEESLKLVPGFSVLDDS